MQKTLFLITGLGVGGAERFLLKVLPLLDKDKILVVSITGLNQIGKELEKKGIKVVYLNENKSFKISTIFKFRRVIKKFKPKIMFTFLIHSDIFGRIFGRLFGVKRIYCSPRNDYSKITSLWRLDKYTRFLVTKYYPNSYGLSSYMSKLKVKNYDVIENGLDVESLEEESKKGDIRKELKLLKKDFVSVCVARLEKQKNHELLLNAFKKFDGKLLLVGDGSYREELEKKIKEYKLEDKVFILGTRDDVASILRSSDTFILPSFTEGMSNALLEAMALGKNCLVSDIKQNSVLIKNKDMRFKTADELVKKLEKVKQDEKLQKIEKEKNRKIIKEDFDIHVIIGKLKEVLK